VPTSTRNRGGELGNVFFGFRQERYTERGCELTDPSPAPSAGPGPDHLWPVVGILACDHVTDDDLLAASGGRDYGQMYTDLLLGAEPRLRTRVYDVVGGELPGYPGECDAWIITGSRHDSYRDEPWIVALRRFIADVREHRARTVGICFGHQVMAHALGGRAEPAGTWQAGPLPLRLEPTDWFEGGTVTVNAMHQDVVSVLPPGSQAIGSGPTAEHPAYLVGDTMLGIQDHPEFDRAYITALVRARRDRLGPQIADDALRRIADDATDNPTVARWIVDFLLDRRR
jgi:GMP synthase-like glutamine amidotransferase